MATVVLLTSCSSTSNVNKTDPYNATVSNPRPFPVHGNFCGVSHPSYSPSDSRESHISKLKSISPIDTLDMACKDHDICYANEGFRSKSCDDALVRSVRPMKFSAYSLYRCESIKSAILAYFQGVNKNYVDSVAAGSLIAVNGASTFVARTGTSVLGAAVNTTVSVVSAPFAVAEYALTGGRSAVIYNSNIAPSARKSAALFKEIIPETKESCFPESTMRGKVFRSNNIFIMKKPINSRF